MNKNNIGCYLILLSLITYGLYIPRVSIVSIIVVFPIALILLKDKKIKKNEILDFHLIFGFITVYYFISASKHLSIIDQSSIMTIINILLLYILGSFLGKNFKNVTLITISTVLGLSLFSILSVRGEMELINSTSVIPHRAVHSVWLPNGGYVNGPVLGVFLSLGIALVGILFTKSSKIVKLGCLVIVYLCVTANNALINRTPLLTGLLIALILFFIYLRDIRKSNRSTLKFFFIISILIILGTRAFTYIQKVASTSALLDRISAEGVNTSRYELWMNGFETLIKHPLIGADTLASEFGFYSHNFWLDLGVSSGLFPLILILAYQMRQLTTIIFLIKRKPYTYVISGVLISFFISFMVEPVIVSSPVYVSLFIFYTSFLSSYVRTNYHGYIEHNFTTYELSKVT